MPYADVRDIAGWVVDCVEQKRAGTHNICGPREPHSMRTFLESTRDAIGSQANLVWMDADFLREEQGVRSFVDIPLWAPLDEDEGFFQIDGSKALDAGMSSRPIHETAQAASEWYQSYFFKDTRFPVGGLGLSREREIEILEAWKNRG